MCIYIFHVHQVASLISNFESPCPSFNTCEMGRNQAEAERKALEMAKEVIHEQLVLQDLTSKGVFEDGRILGDLTYLVVDAEFV